MVLLNADRFTPNTESTHCLHVSTEGCLRSNCYSRSKCEAHTVNFGVQRQHWSSYEQVDPDISYLYLHKQLSGQPSVIQGSHVR